MRYLLAGSMLALSLAACSMGGGLDPGPSGRALDLVHDDVANLLIAFDLPRGLGTAASGSLFLYDVANGGPSEHLRLTLVPVEADPASARLPPPQAGRAYYFYGFNDADKPALQAAQASAQARNLSASGVSVSLIPKLCTTPGVDAGTATVTILATVPGQTRAMPFMTNQPLEEIKAQAGSTLIPYCN